MTPTTVFDTYWRFAAERQAMFLRRLEDPGGRPWTDDAILRNYRFTNTYRVSDRVSQYLVRDVQQRADRPSGTSEIFFRTMLFKIFNRIETWELLERELGPLEWASLDLEILCKVLDGRIDRGDRIYSAAYIMPSPAFGHARKHANHLALIEKMMEDALPDAIERASGLAQVYELLLAYPGIGPFLAFQYAIDLNYSDFLDFAEDEFVVAGPGALDGISKCFADANELDPQQIIFWAYENQEREFERLGIDFQSLFGRRLQPIDCQNVFCEISKYARVAHPEVEGVAKRTRIKQTYSARPDPLPHPVFPRRWNLEICEPDTLPARRTYGDQPSLFW